MCVGVETQRPERAYGWCDGRGGRCVSDARGGTPRKLAWCCLHDRAAGAPVCPLGLIDTHSSCVCGRQAVRVCCSLPPTRPHTQSPNVLGSGHHHPPGWRAVCAAAVLPHRHASVCRALLLPLLRPVLCTTACVVHACAPASQPIGARTACLHTHSAHCPMAPRGAVIAASVTHRPCPPWCTSRTGSSTDWRQFQPQGTCSRWSGCEHTAP